MSAYLAQALQLPGRQQQVLTTRLKCPHKAPFGGCLQDLPQLDAAALWQHFVMHGQHEGRSFRYSCTPKVMTALEAFAAGQQMSAPLEDVDGVEPAAAAAASAVAAASLSEGLAAPTTSSEAIVTPTVSIKARQLLHLQEGAS